MPIVAFALAALLTVGAQAAAADQATQRIPRGDRLVLQASTGGGLVPIEVTRNQIPELTITGNGRVITLGPTTLEYPPAALPNLQEGSISRARVRRLVAAAAALGLLGEEHGEYGEPGITDQAATTVTVVADGERSVTSVYALGYEGDELTDDQLAARDDLIDFLGAASDTRTTEPYVIERLAVLVARGDRAAQEGAPIPWPLGDLGEVLPPADSDAEGCVLVTGTDLATVLDAARGATTLTPWTSNGETYSLAFRPLLPNERDCDDV
jgi:hypothetical protein